MATGVGTATVDFGSFPGSSEAIINVTSQTGITTNSYVEAWAGGDWSTSDHTSDEHYMEELMCWVDTLINNVGFSITVRPATGSTYGQYKVNYAWST